MRSGPPFGPGFGWYGLYTSWSPVTEVHQYDIATIETTLFAADGKRVLWSGMTETYEPTSVARDAPGDQCGTWSVAEHVQSICSGGQHRLGSSPHHDRGSARECFLDDVARYVH